MLTSVPSLPAPKRRFRQDHHPTEHQFLSIHKQHRHHRTQDTNTRTRRRRETWDKTSKKRERGATGGGAAQANLPNEWGIVPAWLTPSTCVWSLADGSSGRRAGGARKAGRGDRVGRRRKEECEIAETEGVTRERKTINVLRKADETEGKERNTRKMNNWYTFWMEQTTAILNMHVRDDDCYLINSVSNK